MYSHIQIGARDVPALAVFYDGVLATLGLVRIVHDDEDRGPAGAAGSAPDFTGRSFTFSRRSMVCPRPGAMVCR